MKKWLFLMLILIMLGCSSNALEPSDGAPDTLAVNVNNIKDAVPRFEPRSRSSNPKSYEVLGKRYSVLADGRNYKQRGIASWYGTKFHGKKTSNGEVYDMYAMTAAHKTLPIPSYVRVTNLQNKRSVVVRVNDRGPFHENRIIDLSYVAAIKLDIQKQGTGFVEVVSVLPEQTTVQKDSNKPQKTIANDLIYLQAGAFSSQFNAETLKNRIDTQQPSLARIKTTTQAGKTIYKIQLGPIASAAQADQVNAMLAKMGIANSHFITEKSSKSVPMLQ